MSKVGSVRRGARRKPEKPGDTAKDADGQQDTQLAQPDDNGDDDDDNNKRDNGSHKRVVGGGEAFEMVVLGSGGGPLETDCSGYLLKPLRNAWEDGFIALEGGSGLGALSTLMSQRPANDMFPNVDFPPSHDTPILRAAYIFSFLACYLVTHAHLDHTLSLILLSGSVPPPPPSSVLHRQPPISGLTTPRAKSSPNDDASSTPSPRPPVYATRATLEKLALAYGGELWPELGRWARERKEDAKAGRARAKRRKVEDPPSVDGSVIFSPMTPSRFHRPLHPTLPITTLVLPVSHGCTTKGAYDSSAIFMRYDPSSLSPEHHSSSSSSKVVDEASHGEGREFLFFGDVESEWRAEGEEGVDVDKGKRAGEMNRRVWEEAARSWKEGRLAAIFIECSYDSSRPAHLMYGHVSPPGVYHELKTLAGIVGADGNRKPLAGLRVFITHIKDALTPNPDGSARTAREVIMGELRALEAQGGLGVEFVEVVRGDRILI